MPWEDRIGQSNILKEEKDTWSWQWISSKKDTKSGSSPLRSANPPTHSCEKLVLPAKSDRGPWQTCPELQKRLRNGFGPREIASDLSHHDRSTQRVVRGATSEAGTYRRASTKAKLVSFIDQWRCSVSQPIRELPIKSERLRKPANRRTLNGVSCQVGAAPLVNQWESF